MRRCLIQLPADEDVSWGLAGEATVALGLQYCLLLFTCYCKPVSHCRNSCPCPKVISTKSLFKCNHLCIFSNQSNGGVGTREL